MGIAVLEIPPPPSVNATNRGRSPQARHKRKRQAQAELARLLLAANVPRPIPGGRVRATAHVLFPSGRRRDEDNYRAGLAKALGDALAPAPTKEERELGLDPLHVWLPDDTPDHFTFGAVTFGRTDVVEYLDANGRKVRRRTPAVAIITLAWGEDLARLLADELDALRAQMLGETTTAEPEHALAGNDR